MSSASYTNRNIDKYRRTIIFITQFNSLNSVQHKKELKKVVLKLLFQIHILYLFRSVNMKFSHKSILDSYLFLNPFVFNWIFIKIIDGLVRSWKWFLLSMVWAKVVSVIEGPVPFLTQVSGILNFIEDSNICSYVLRNGDL